MEAVLESAQRSNSTSDRSIVATGKDLDSSCLSPLARFEVRPIVLAAVLAIVYAVLLLIINPNAYLSTDVGGKTASVEAMVDRNDWDPDITYWFESADPEGELFAYSGTRQSKNGQWINTTSFPMVYAARPLWAVGGPRLAMVLPALGAIATALLAGALERRIRPGASGTVSTLIVGLASPTLVYALDFWEHSIGLAGMAAGVVAVMDATTKPGTGPRLRARPAVASAVLAGLGFGFAATMRQEAFVYGAVAGLVLLAVSLRQAGVAAALIRSLAMAVGALAMLASHIAAEILLTGSPFRLSRSAGAVAGASAGLSARLKAGLVTLLSPLNGDHPVVYLLGLLLVAALVWITISSLSGRDVALARVYALVVGCVLGAILVSFGPRFVPGLVPTTPLAVVGVAAAVHFRRWKVLLLGVGPLPLLIAVQYPQGAFPQWAGRYLLFSGLVMMVAGIALVLPRHPKLVATVAAFGCAMSLFGVLWTYERKDQVAADFETLDALTDSSDVVVWRDPVRAREGGPQLLGQRWLSAPFTPQQDRAAALLAQAGISEFLWIHTAPSNTAQSNTAQSNTAPSGTAQSNSTVPVVFAGYHPEEIVGELEFFEVSITRFVAD